MHCCWCDMPLWRTALLPSADFFCQCVLLLLLVNVSLKMLQVSWKTCQSTVWQLWLRCLHPSLDDSRREASQPPLSHTTKGVGCESSLVGSDLGLYQYQPQLLCVHPPCFILFLAYPFLMIQHKFSYSQHLLSSQVWQPSWPPIYLAAGSVCTHAWFYSRSLVWSSFERKVSGTVISWNETKYSALCKCILPLVYLKLER